MKNNLINICFTLGLSTFICCSCENAGNTVIDNLVYFSEAASAKTEIVSLEGQDITTSLTVRLAKAIDVDVNVEIAIDESILIDYNLKNESDIRMVDAANLEFVTSAVIPAGSISAAPIDITVHPFESNGVQYAIPIRIISVDGPVEKSEASSQFIFMLEQPLVQSVPSFIYSNNMEASPEEDWGVVLSNYTLEWWCKMSGFSVNNQAIFNFDTDSELYIRFGDLVYASGNGYVYNFLQIKAMGSQFDTGDPTAGNGLNADTWYHFAITYDASTGTTSVYKNGTFLSSLVTEVGKPLTINGMAMVCSGSSYFYDTCEMCQVRLWKTTRSANQISSNMNKAVDSTNKDLILYLPMDEGEGSVLYDKTGNGHDVNIGNVGGNTTAKAWNTYTFGN